MNMVKSERSDGPVFVTGGSGFVGRYVVQALLKNGHRVRLLLRSPEQFSIQESRVDVTYGDILDPESIDVAMRECSAAIHLVGIIRENSGTGTTFDRVHVEGTHNTVSAARKAGIRTFIHMSANGASADGTTGYSTSKWKAEELVRSADFNHFTIFRPSVIFGEPGPGCPVCICPEEDVYEAIQIALHEDVILVAFGDMLRVPVNAPKREPRSLEQARAAGGDIHIEAVITAFELRAIGAVDERVKEQMIDINIDFRIIDDGRVTEFKAIKPPVKITFQSEGSVVDAVAHKERAIEKASSEIAKEIVSKIVIKYAK